MKLFNWKKEEKLLHPWDKYYEKDKRTIEVPDCSIYHFLERSVFNYGDKVAINYFGKKISFNELIEKIDVCAKALRSQGVRKGDVVTICMPNTPEAVIAFYATNKIGAIANMIHPLSSQEEIKNSIAVTKSVLVIAINLSYEKIKNIVEETDVYKVVIVSAKDSMPSILGLGYLVTKELKMELPKTDECFMSWNAFYSRGFSYNKDVEIEVKKNDPALYLHSGGTTGIPKNIILSNGNINTIMKQAKIIFPRIGVNDTFLSILPMFHCFGLVVCICAPLMFGSEVVLVPQFDAKRFDKLIRKYKPTVLTGVPTLYEALVTNPYMINVDLSEVKYVISGGDSLSPERNKIVNEFLKKHNCNQQIMQGYGMTESTGPVSIGALGSDKLGSIGIPLPGNNIKILDVNTKEELNIGEIGEICINGPSVMMGYLDNEEATNNILVEHPDGTKWIHTGDLGYMDEDGVLFFVQRLKRMLIVSGYNVYPAYVEDVILRHPKVEMCGVIGVPHPYKVQVPKAFVVPKEGVKGNAQLVKELKDFCEKNMAKYMIPKEIVFRDSLPKTMVGKIDYKVLEKEESNKKTK